MAGRLCLVSSPGSSQCELFSSFLRENISTFPRDATLHTADDKDCRTLAERLAAEFQGKRVCLNHDWDKRHTQGVKPTDSSPVMRTVCAGESFGEETEDAFRKRLGAVFSDFLSKSSTIVFCPPCVLDSIASLYSLGRNLLVLDCRLAGGELRCEQQILLRDFEEYARGKERSGGYLKRVEEAVRQTVREVRRKGDETEEELLRNITRIVSTAFQTVESHYESQVSQLNSQIEELKKQLAASSHIFSDFHRIREEQTCTLSELQRILSLLQSKQQKIDDSGLKERLERCEKQQKEAHLALEKLNEEKSAEVLGKPQKDARMSSFSSLRKPANSSPHTSPLIKSVNPQQSPIRFSESKPVLVNKRPEEVAAPLAFKRGFLLPEKPKQTVVPVPEPLPQSLITIRKESRPLIQPTVISIERPLGSSKPQAISEEDIEKRRREVEETLGERLSEEANAVLEAVLRTEDGRKVPTEDLITRLMDWKG